MPAAKKTSSAVPMPKGKTAMTTATTTTHRNRLVRFNPEINTGNILVVIAMVSSCYLAYGALDKQVSNLYKDIDALRAKDVEMTTRGNERYADLKGSIKDLQAGQTAIAQSINDLSVSQAIIRGRMAEPGSARPALR